MNRDKKDRLFELLAINGSKEAFHSLLSKHKEGPSDRSVLVSGNYEDMLKNIRSAHDAGKISEQELVNLLADCEENGGQHILFYLPNTHQLKADLDDADAVEKMLFDGRTAEDLGLPKFYLNPVGVNWADFRKEQRQGTKYRSWTLKMYAGIMRTELVHSDEEVAKEDGIEVTFITRTFKRYPSREVILVKWHSFGLLEIRLPCHKSLSHKTLKDDRDNLLERFQIVFDTGQLRAMDLKPAMIRLLKEAEDKESEYFLHNAEVSDDDRGKIELKLADDDDNVMTSKVRRDLLKRVEECGRLVVNWTLSKQKPNLPERLRVQIGNYFANEIRIGANTVPEAIEYVTRRLHELCR